MAHLRATRATSYKTHQRKTVLQILSLGLKAISLCLFIVPVFAQPPISKVSRLSEDTSYGGTHELGVVVGYSPVSGPVWGYDQNVRYMPVAIRYSYRFAMKRNWSVRYSPEVTALSVMHERTPSTTNPAAPTTHVGSGLSPVGFQLVYRPRSRLQPFFSEEAGFIYYDGRVLSPQGSQWMYTIDFGGGTEIFVRPHDALIVGYRYQHLSNANISLHNPGTDANTFYIGYSHFHSHGVR